VKKIVQLIIHERYHHRPVSREQSRLVDTSVNIEFFIRWIYKHSLIPRQGEQMRLKSVLQIEITFPWQKKAGY
jgi:hypothetical protein